MGPAPKPFARPPLRFEHGHFHDHGHYAGIHSAAALRTLLGDNGSTIVQVRMRVGLSLRRVANARVVPSPP